MISREAQSLGLEILQGAVEEFRGLRRLADGAMSQISDGQFEWVPTPESNSIAVIVKHMSGNIRSRWGDFLTSDGEKPNRNRDAEFEIDASDNRSALMKQWEDAWAILFDTLHNLEPADVTRTVTIRNQPYTVVRAINRQLTHYGYHVGQIVQLARQQRGASWRTLSVPRGGSEALNMDAAQRFPQPSESTTTA